MYCPNPECDDLVQTGRPGEYAEGVTVCPVCGATLAPGNPAPGSELSCRDGSHDLETVFETSDPTEIPVVTALLRSEGIDCMVRGEERFDPFRGALSALRFNPLAGRAEVVVPREQAEEARQILRHLADQP